MTSQAPKAPLTPSPHVSLRQLAATLAAASLTCATCATSLCGLAWAEDNAPANTPTGEQATAPQAKAKASVAFAYPITHPLALATSLNARTIDQGSTIAPLADATAEGIDLTKLFEDAQSLSAASITLKQGGTYYLSDDVTTSKYLTIKAPGEDVTLNLNGHTLTFDTPQINRTQAQGILLTSAKSLTIEGSLSTTGENQLILVSSKSTVGLGSLLVDNAANAAVCVRNVGMSISTTGDGATLRNFATSAIRHMYGSLTVEDCSLSVDLSNQMETNNTANQMTGCPIGIYAGYNATSFSISRTNITVCNTPKVAVNLSKKDAFESASGASSPGNAYGIYSLNENTALQASDLAINVSSPLGIATGICVAALELQPAQDGRDVTANGQTNTASVRSTDSGGQGGTTGRRDATSGQSTTIGQGVTINVNAAQYALGIDAAGTAGSAFINTPVRVTFDGMSWAPINTALYSKTENAFVFGQGLTSSPTSVLIGSPENSPNASGMRIGSFAENVPESQRDTLAARLENALGADEPCRVSYDEEGLFFLLDVSRSAARSVDPSGEVTYFSSAQKALDEATAQHVIVLQRDASDLVFNKNDESDNTYTLDLNGFSANSVACTGTAQLCVTSSSPGGNIQGTVSPAVTVGPSARLSLDNCSVTCNATSQKTVGVSVGNNAQLQVDNASISAFSSTSMAQGIAASGHDTSITLNNVTVSATTFAPTASALGITASQEGGTINVDASSISASSISGVCGAIDSATNVLLANTTLRAKTDGAASFAWGLRLTGSQAQGALDTVDVAVSSEKGTTPGSYWCLQPDSTINPSNNVSWSLSGSSAFTSTNCTAICMNGSPISLDSSFANLVGPITVASYGLEDNTFCLGAKTGQSIAAFASSFMGAPGTACEGWECIVDPKDDTKLMWTHASTVKNNATGNTYANLNSAVTTAAAGDTLTLMEDFNQSGSLSLDKDLTLDLAGHSFAINAYDQASEDKGETAGALALTGGSTLRIIDSGTQGKGNLTLAVGSLQETVTTVGNTYQGFTVSEGSRLVLDGCNAQVTYAGRGVTDRAKAVGCAVISGSLELCNNAQLRVSSEDAKATQLSGVILSNNAQALSQEPGCAIFVDNVSKDLVEGALPTSKSLSTNTSVIARNVNLVQIFPEEGSALYQEIQQKFLERAKYDGLYSADTSDDSFVVHETRCFYATHLALDSGRLIWAFSDPVPQDDAGDLSNVVATTFFTPARYSTYPTAEAVTASEGFLGTVTLEGTVLAQCPNGNATSLDLSSSCTGRISSTATIAAYASEQAQYRLDEAFDLRHYLANLEGADGAITYPKNDSQHLVTYQKGVAKTASDITRGNPGIVFDRGVTQDARPASPTADPLTDLGTFHADTINVTFEGARNAEGILQPATTIQRPWGSPIVATETELPQAQDYTLQGITYRFVGWTASTSLGPLTCTTSGLANSIYVDSSLAGSQETNITLQAAYQIVSDNQYLASFVVDSYVFSYAAEKGTRPQYRQARPNQQTDIPSKIKMEDDKTYAFMGWARTNPDLAPAVDGTLPPSNSDVTYEASFQEDFAPCSVSFVLWTTTVDPADGKVKPSKKTVTQTFDYHQDPSSAAAALASENESFVLDGNKRFVFQGWTARPSDSSPVFATELPATYCANVTYYALYSSQEFTCTVNFYVGDTLYATADNVLPTASIDAAWRATGKSDPAAKDNHPFRGWGISPTADKRITTNLVTAQELANPDGVINLYALHKTDATIVDPPAGEDDEQAVTTPEGEKNQAPTATKIDVSPTDLAPIVKTPVPGTTPTPSSVTGAADTPAADMSIHRPTAETADGALSEGKVDSTASSPQEGLTASAITDSTDNAEDPAEGQSQTAQTVGIALAVIAALLAAAWAAKRGIEDVLTRRQFKEEEEEASQEDIDEGIVF